jgi:hypothetical protein
VRSRAEKLRQYEEWLQREYGGLLRLEDLAQVLRYPSVQAVRQARYRGRLPVEVFRISARRGWFATSQAVAGLLATAEEDGHSQPAEGRVMG